MTVMSCFTVAAQTLRLVRNTRVDTPVGTELAAPAAATVSQATLARESTPSSWRGNRASQFVF